jgi:glycosyltransferase involved in cell wall biosynthesis
MNFKFSILIPCYNEVGTVFDVVTNICNSFPNELVVVVDDGSTDGSYNQLLKVKSKNLKIIQLEKNMGKGFALRTGLEYLENKSEIVIFTDADTEILVEDLLKVSQMYENPNVEIVFGSRFLEISNIKKFKMGIHRYLANLFLTIISNLAFRQKLTDMETAVKSFKTSLIKYLNLTANRFDIEPELVKELTNLEKKIHEVSISYNPRSRNEGKKISFKDGISTLMYLLRNHLKII